MKNIKKKEIEKEELKREEEDEDDDDNDDEDDDDRKLKAIKSKKKLSPSDQEDETSSSISRDKTSPIGETTESEAVKKALDIIQESKKKDVLPLADVISGDSIQQHIK